MQGIDMQHATLSNTIFFFNVYRHYRLILRCHLKIMNCYWLLFDRRFYKVSNVHILPQSPQHMLFLPPVLLECLPRTNKPWRNRKTSNIFRQRDQSGGCSTSFFPKKHIILAFWHNLTRYSFRKGQNKREKRNTVKICSLLNVRQKD